MYLVTRVLPTPLGPVRPLVHGATPPSAADVPRRAAELIAAQFDKVAAAAEGCDALVASGLMPAVAARSVAEKLGIRSVYVSYCPIFLPSPHHPPHPLPGRPFPPGVTDNRVLNDLDVQSYNALFGAALNTHRASIGLPPVDNVPRPHPRRPPVAGGGPGPGPLAGAGRTSTSCTTAARAPRRRPPRPAHERPPWPARSAPTGRRWPRRCCSTRSAGKGRQCPREPRGIVEPGPRTREPANPGDLNRNGHGVHVRRSVARHGHQVRHAGPGALPRPMVASDLRSELMT